MQGGYTNPNRKKLAGDLLDDADSREQVSLEDALQLLAKLGKTGTLVSDGRKSCAKRPMWNCLLHTSMGVFLIEICDTSHWRLDMSDEETKGDWIAQKLVHHIDKINGMAGAAVIDQVITDSAGDCKKARRLLKEKYGGRICVSACAAHTLDLLLEDIGKHKRFAKVIAKLRVIAEYKDANGGKELDKHCATRFCTEVYMAESAKANFEALKKTVVSKPMDAFMKCKKKPNAKEPSYFSFTKGEGLSHHQLGKLTKECVLCPAFWKDVDDFLAVTAEVFKALRLTDCENPTSAEIFMRMAAMKSSLENNTFVAADGREFELNDAEHETILKAFESRWEMLHSPIHSAAFTLNPRYTHVHSFSGDAQLEHDELLLSWLSEADVHLYKDQFRNFKEKTGIFANPILWSKTALEKDADAWWGDWGAGKKVLHDFAVRVTSQPISIGAAERCWKAYAHIHCPKRNRLGPERAPKLVRVHYNLRLRRKRSNPEYEDVHLPAMALDPIEEAAGDLSVEDDSD